MIFFLEGAGEAAPQDKLFSDQTPLICVSLWTDGRKTGESVEQHDGSEGMGIY